MIVYYVEGDGGHLMTEIMGKQEFRTVVRGSCVSYHMPWEDIMEQLLRHGDDRGAMKLPRPQECLKYMLRLHLRVNGLDFKRHLKQVQVRPFVLIALLDYLIDQNHECFRGKEAPEVLKRQIRLDVAREYPENDAVPESLLEVMADSAEQRKSDGKKLRIINEKNATPGNGARCLEECLDDLRPHSVCLDRSAKACSDTATRQAAAYERYGGLKVQVQQKDKEIVQFHPKYISQALPFVIPRMVSGPDFFPHRPWRRIYEDAPKVTAPQFCAAFARRVEAPCRTDWTALPMVRSVAYKFVAEHTMTAMGPTTGKRGAAAEISSAELVKAAESLYNHLHHGFTGSGVHRVPIAGNTTRLPFANGLTPLVKCSFKIFISRGSYGLS